MQTKKFSTYHHTKYDKPAKTAITKWLQKQGWECKENPDRLGIDLIATSPNGHTWQIEVEVKNKWQTGTFKYDTLHIAGRKEKFITKNTIHITINELFTHFVLVPTHTLQNSTRITKNTIYTQNEKFIEIQIKDCTIHRLEEQ